MSLTLYDSENVVMKRNDDLHNRVILISNTVSFVVILFSYPDTLDIAFFHIE